MHVKLKFTVGTSDPGRKKEMTEYCLLLVLGGSGANSELQLDMHKARSRDELVTK